MGIVIYAIVVLIVYLTDRGEWAGIVTVAVAGYFSPVILLGLLIGWLTGRAKEKKNNFVIILGLILFILILISAGYYYAYSVRIKNMNYYNNASGPIDSHILY